MIIQSCDVIKLFAREFERILVGGQVFVHNGLAIRRVAHKLAHVAGCVRHIARTAQVVGMEIEEVGKSVDYGLVNEAKLITKYQVIMNQFLKWKAL